MSALRRAETDEQAGDLGAARQRLVSYIVTTHYRADVCERIARLCVRMHDLTEAGKWYFLCDSRDEEAPACIERFRTRHGNDPKSIVANLPRAIVSVRRGADSQIVVRRLEEVGAVINSKQSRTRRSDPGGSRLLTFGCLSGLVLLVVSCGIGLTTIVRWIWGQW